MGIESISAIQECMEALDLHPSKERSYTVEASIQNSKSGSRGNIFVTFNCNWHSGDGPYLEFDDSIKGFGLKYVEYKPQWLEFSFDESLKELSVKGKDYSFVLGFI